MSGNAARQNYLHIREQQELNRERAREAAEEERRTQEFLQRHKEQYNHVPSHGYGHLRGGNDDVEIKVFIRECDRDRAQTFCFMEKDVLQRRGNSETKPPPQPVQGLPRFPAQPKRQQPVPVSPANVSRGVVPKYILQRKAELAAEKVTVLREIERQKEIAKYPPGHRPVTEEERKDTLEKLATRRKELEVELHKIPIRYDTQSIKARRNKIEGELKEIDEAERKFSAAKQLFVPI
ncbi:flagellar/basal body protein [Trypanosoma rangeli]|uniref:Flagellar/basal body protein n=1 Tax=Trypanosoma rangeli TaxID=5698 RepID=A0A422NYA8_TRYRA|nr:flagellar/basal body protein [Trypanosoma rangeli]RNF10411.1 flagellar/basal body protein [Trypanosoma rangeli]|eukprot:RNF10411.1 flagellar/basal body protein [Trypanosoma rangeli]